MKQIGINDITGFRTGNAQSISGKTGCTVVICKNGATGGVSIRGSAPGTRETDILSPYISRDALHAVILSGGSAFGLDAASGVMKYLEERGIGVKIGSNVIPVVSSAILYDLEYNTDNDRPDKAMGYAACVDSESDFIKSGPIGAAAGATAGKAKGIAFASKTNLGVYAIEHDGIQMGAIVAVNSFGEITDPDTGSILAGIKNDNGTGFISTYDHLLNTSNSFDSTLFTGTNTTLGIIMTNVRLTKTEANKLASISHDGMARTIRPVHTSMDGDAVFCMASNSTDIDRDFTIMEILAAKVTEGAIKAAAIA